MRAQLQEVENEAAFFASEAAQKEVEAVQVEREKAIDGKRLADEHLAVARRADETEKAGDEFAAHIAAILEHGEAVGLLDGHCPLCDALRTQSDFAAAIAAARTRLAARGETLSATAAALRAGISEVATAEQALVNANRRYAELERRPQALDHALKTIREGYSRLGFRDPLWGMVRPGRTTPRIAVLAPI